jgi:hypothetical protein
MTTREESLTQDARTTPVTALPPLDVTTEGVPAAELLRPAAELAAEDARRQHRRDVFVWALSGVLVLVAVVAGLLLWLPSTSSVHMGLSDAAWSEYRAGERAVLLVPAVHGSDWTDYRSGERSA